MRAHTLLTVVILAAAVVLAPSMVGAAPPTPAEKTASAKVEAKKAFQAGVAAFKLKQSERAAEHFERAFKLAPHPQALWNAADSREKAGELASAANHYSHFLALSDREKDRIEAHQRLEKLETRLAVIEVFGPDASEVEVDRKRVVDAARVYVLPGSHVVTGKVEGNSLSRKVTVKAGATAKVRLVPESDKPKEPVAPASTAAPPPSDHGSRPGPAVFWIGAGVTAVLAGVTAWSGLDTRSKRSDFDFHPSAQLYDDGIAAQYRTNYLLGATAAAGVATTILGVYVVRWKRPQEPAVSLSPRGVAFGMRF